MNAWKVCYAEKDVRNKYQYVRGINVRVPQQLASRFITIPTTAE